MNSVFSASMSFVRYVGAPVADGSLSRAEVTVVCAPTPLLRPSPAWAG